MHEKKSEKHGNLEKRRAKKKSRIVLSSNTPKMKVHGACICAHGSCTVYCAYTGPHSRPEHLLILYHDNMFNL